MSKKMSDKNSQIQISLPKKMRKQKLTKESKPNHLKFENIPTSIVHDIDKK